MDKKELWLRLKAYHFNNLVPTNLLAHIREAFGGIDAFTKAFANKIARKHQWKNSFALRAVNEYKKFVYLGVVSDFVVTPSKVIDVVWHEHILFSKAYRDFCNDVIGYTFDHSPELLPDDNQVDLFSAQYLDTLNLYEIEFGFPAPENIWSDTKFDEQELKKKQVRSQLKSTTVYADGGYDNSMPLHAHFSGADSSAGSFPEFGGFDGGDFGGAGASGDWGSSDSNSSDSGSDSGSSCSSCSSGCGGGD